ncbi:hypothetical protein LEMLEM_LOCUS7692 [Lemmus lemmus]
MLSHPCCLYPVLDCEPKQTLGMGGEETKKGKTQRQSTMELRSGPRALEVLYMAVLMPEYTFGQDCTVNTPSITYKRTPGNYKLWSREWFLRNQVVRMNFSSELGHIWSWFSNWMKPTD